LTTMRNVSSASNNHMMISSRDTEVMMLKIQLCIF